MNQPADTPRPESLFDLGEPDADWTDADLAAMLRHLLDAPGQCDGKYPTIRALLSDAAAPIHGLQALKDLAKARRSEASAVPPDIWRVVYFASIARAARAGTVITELSNHDLRTGYRWVLAKPWLDPQVRHIIEQSAMI
jgi:hypothetical protein